MEDFAIVKGGKRNIADTLKQEEPKIVASEVLSVQEISDSAMPGSKKLS